MKTEKRKFGDLGEDVACKFLVNHGFKILEKNYLKKCGEIDIVAEKDHKIDFIEVKTVSCESITSVNHETADQYRPEDNIHQWKVDRLKRTIETYLIEKGIGEEKDWQFHVITVYLDIKTKKAKVNFLENIIL